MPSYAMIKRFTPLAPIALVLTILFSLEVALEWRHYRRCFDTPIFGSKDCTSAESALEITSGETDTSDVPATAPRYGPVDNWPYRSLVPSAIQTQRTVVWIASASHAEHTRLAPELVFPNLICGALSYPDSECLVVNGSRAGFSITDNIELLEQAPEVAIPDVAVLYQMATFLASRQRKIVNGSQESSSEDNAPAAGELLYRQTLAALSREFQSTSLYLQLSQIVGSTIKLAGFRDKQLQGALDAYLDEVGHFVEYCKEHDILPVLTTFAIAYDHINYQSAPRSLQMTFVRENPTLSLEGYAHTVHELNVELREFARQRELLIIDLAAVAGGRSELFVDLVHFNPLGHQRIAETIAADLEAYLNRLRRAL
ncbi:hypothetical protein N9383_00090 [Granulosicoccus sp.]|nr:hypothetical protein [Granulosicoccus sp.]